MGYKGIGPEAGRCIPDYEAFGSACDRCLTGTDEEQRGFMELAHACQSLDEFAREVVDWYYSGNWIRDEKPEKNAWIIRFGDKSHLAYYGTYEEVVKVAREEAGKKNMSYIIA